jgi:uncharacterized protein YebE (UPF0316 family)
MFQPEFMDTNTFTYLVLPVLIFLARTVDVSMGTLRIILISRGNKLLAPMLGFFEVLIWLIAIGQIMQNLSNVFCYVAYAGGFAFGNFVGMSIEERVAIGKVVVRVMTYRDPSSFMAILRERGYGVTHLPAEGGKGPVHVVFTIINRANLETVIRIVETHHPNAFYTIEDIRAVKDGVFPENENLFQRILPKPPRALRRYRTMRRQSRRKAK